MNRVVAATLIGATGASVVGCALPAHATEPAPEVELPGLGETNPGIVSDTTTTGAPEVDPAAYNLTDSDAASLAEAVEDLERMKNRMSPEELEDARRELWALYTRLGSAATPSDRLEVGSEKLSRGEKRMLELADALERRMRVTARDIAHPDSVELVEGAPGYKVLSEGEVRDLFLDALREIPLRELPGGVYLANLVKTIPGAPSNPEQLTADEIGDALGDHYEEWFDAKFGAFLEDHKYEVGIAGFAAVTAARMASDDAAELLNDVIPRIKIHSEDYADGHITTRADLKYRGNHALPDLDLRGYAYTDLGPVRIRADLRGTLSAEADEHVTGRALLGARVGTGKTWADLYGTIDHDSVTTANLRLGHRTDDGWRMSGTVSSRFGDGAAIDPDASGRVSAEVDITRTFDFKGAEGDFGFYAGGGVDTNGENDDVRGGLIFRLRF